MTEMALIFGAGFAVAAPLFYAWGRQHRKIVYHGAHVSCGLGGKTSISVGTYGK
jgi:hypothetical protein